MGVSFPALNIKNLHSMYADDSIVLTEAQMQYVLECKRILDDFGATSGLHCDWDNTKAAYIPGGPPPPEFGLLPWKWEVDATATNLLGLPIASDFSVHQMEAQIRGKVEPSILKLKK